MAFKNDNSSIFDDNSDELAATENPLWYCHNETAGSKVPTWEVAKSIVYWVEGFSLTTTAILGIIGNLITCLVLKKLGRLNSNVFNQVSVRRDVIVLSVSP